MYNLNKITIFVLLLMLLTSCDQIVNKVGSEYLKISLKDTCGKDHPACVAAVDEQFDSCHSKYEHDWNNYINSSLSKEDALLKIYSENMYGCIVDENGAPYFVFDPE